MEKDLKMTDAYTSGYSVDDLKTQQQAAYEAMGQRAYTSSGITTGDRYIWQQDISIDTSTEPSKKSTNKKVKALEKKIKILEAASKSSDKKYEELSARIDAWKILTDNGIKVTE